MAYFEALTDEAGNPALLVIAKAAKPELLDALAAFDRAPAPDETAVVVDTLELMAWLGDNLDAELAT